MTNKMILLSCIILSVLLSGCGSTGFKYETLEAVCDYAEVACDLIEFVVDTVEVDAPPQIHYVSQCVIAGDFRCIYFDTDKAEILDEALPVLNQIILTMENCPELSAIVEGHCDERRSDNYNYHLGKQRAGAVRNWLIDHDVESWKITTMSYGENIPFADGHGKDFWKLNRRVEIRIE